MISEVFKHTAQGDLNLHIFQPPGHAPEATAPAIIFFFGGGFKTGHPKQFFPHCRHLSDRGFVAISAEYRVFDRHGTTPAESAKDGKSALRYVRNHAGRLGIDPERIAAAGGSAGGQIAAASFFLPGFDEDADQGISCRPDALVLYNPVLDTGETGYAYDRVSAYWREFSPIHNIGDQAPPTIMYIGDQDEIIPVSTIQACAEKIEKCGSPVEYHVFEGQVHGFFNYDRRENGCYDRIEELTDRFFRRIGWLGE